MKYESNPYITRYRTRTRSIDPCPYKVLWSTNSTMLTMDAFNDDLSTFDAIDASLITREWDVHSDLIKFLAQLTIDTFIGTEYFEAVHDIAHGIARRTGLNFSKLRSVIKECLEQLHRLAVEGPYDETYRFAQGSTVTTVLLVYPDCSHLLRLCMILSSMTPKNQVLGRASSILVEYLREQKAKELGIDIADTNITGSSVMEGLDGFLRQSLLKHHKFPMRPDVTLAERFLHQGLFKRLGYPIRPDVTLSERLDWLRVVRHSDTPNNIIPFALHHDPRGSSEWKGLAMEYMQEPDTRDKSVAQQQRDRAWHDRQRRT